MRVSPEPFAINLLAQEHLARVRGFYDQVKVGLKPGARHYRAMLAQYYRHIVPADASVLEIGCGQGDLLRLLPNRDVTGVDVSPRQVERARANVPHGVFHVMAGEELRLDRTFDYILLSDTANEAADVQALLEAALTAARPDTRLVVNIYNALWRPLLALLCRLGLRHRHPPQNWLSTADVANLLKLGGWELIRREERVLMPARIPLLAPTLNRIAPLFPSLCLSNFFVARPEGRGDGAGAGPSVTVVIPARNASGNIDHAVRRTPEMGAGTEIILIEGNSSDDTWEAIQRAVAAHPERRLRAMRQTGKGKGNAVREAFAAATGDILMILDADLTMPPEELPKFYDAIASGRAEFVNGVRLVYPMEDQAMRFLNMCGNKFFGAAFSWMLSQPIKDTLCGTKVLRRSDYLKIAANRAYFGDFDPFGDFDLLFGAAKLNLKIADLPIRYRNRTYGSTNISRFRHGLVLLRMVAYASTKLKFI